MTDKSNFTPDEWKLLLESVMMAGDRRLHEIGVVCFHGQAARG